MALRNLPAAVVVPAAIAIGGFAVQQPVAYGKIVLPLVGCLTFATLALMIWNTGLELAEKLVRVRHPDDKELQRLLLERQMLPILSPLNATVTVLYLLFLWLVPFLNSANSSINP
jgi:hypothetical protein